MKENFQLLGTGGSTGIPVLGCQCHVCTSSDPLNKRLRTQGLLRLGNKNILVDVGPDIRQQCLLYGISHVDAIFITHHHEDHIGGLDDIRGFYFARNREPITVFLSENTYEMIASRFGYLLERFRFIKLSDQKGEFSLFERTFHYFSYVQGSVPVLGFRYKKLSYLTDIKEFDPSLFSFLAGTKTLVISALNSKGSHMHLSFDEATKIGADIRAEKTYLIHMNHEVDHKNDSKKLGIGAFLAHDGMVLDV